MTDKVRYVVKCGGCGGPVYMDLPPGMKQGDVVDPAPDKLGNKYSWVRVCDYCSSDQGGIHTTGPGAIICVYPEESA